MWTCAYDHYYSSKWAFDVYSLYAHQHLVKKRYHSHDCSRQVGQASWLGSYERLDAELSFLLSLISLVTCFRLKWLDYSLYVLKRFGLCSMRHYSLDCSQIDNCLCLQSFLPLSDFTAWQTHQPMPQSCLHLSFLSHSTECCLHGRQTWSFCSSSKSMRSFHSPFHSSCFTDDCA